MHELDAVTDEVDRRAGLFAKDLDPLFGEDAQDYFVMRGGGAMFRRTTFHHSTPVGRMGSLPRGPSDAT